MDAHDQKTQQQESRATADRQGSKSLSEQQGSKCTNQSCWITTNHSRASCFIRSRMTSQPHRLNKTSSMQSKRRDLHHAWLHRETNEKLSLYCVSPRWITTTFSTTLLYLPQLVRMARKLNMLRIGRNKPGTSKTEGLCYAKSRFLCLSPGGFHRSY